jgi:hypothetical protein
VRFAIIMTLPPIRFDPRLQAPDSYAPAIATAPDDDFAEMLAGALAVPSQMSAAAACEFGLSCADDHGLSPRQYLPGVTETVREILPLTASGAARAYETTAAGLPSASMPKGELATQMAMYKEDQLLAHPGGDDYFLNGVSAVYNPAADRSLFENRIGKDLDDVGANLLNLVKDLTDGSEFKYVAADGSIQDGKRVGLMGTVQRFFGDLLSGLTFGAYMPEGEQKPEGFVDSVAHFFKKIFYDAVVKDVLVGVPQSVINMGKDAAFAAINLLQVVPDATIGNFEWGRTLTTTVFDNGQVAVDYLTDIAPGGNAWLRVHAAGRAGDLGLPIFYNLDTPEMGLTDPRWAYVRNTPFRKTIETVGSLLGDAAFSLMVSGQLPGTSSDQRNP